MKLRLPLNIDRNLIFFGKKELNLLSLGGRARVLLKLLLMLLSQLEVVGHLNIDYWPGQTNYNIDTAVINTYKAKLQDTDLIRNHPHT